jgi:hypothetical protein
VNKKLFRVCHRLAVSASSVKLGDVLLINQPFTDEMADQVIVQSGSRLHLSAVKLENVSKRMAALAIEAGVAPRRGCANLVVVEDRACLIVDNVQRGAAALSYAKLLNAGAAGCF